MSGVFPRLYFRHSNQAAAAEGHWLGLFTPRRQTHDQKCDTHCHLKDLVWTVTSSDSFTPTLEASARGGFLCFFVSVACLQFTPKNEVLWQKRWCANSKRRLWHDEQHQTVNVDYSVGTQLFSPTPAAELPVANTTPCKYSWSNVRMFETRGQLECRIW